MYGFGLLAPQEALTRAIPPGPKSNPLMARAGSGDVSASHDPASTVSRADTDTAMAVGDSAGEDDTGLVILVALIAAAIMGVTAVTLVMMGRRPIA
jgi:hypothetical protein